MSPLKRILLVISVTASPGMVHAGDEFSDLAPFTQPHDPSRNAGRPGTGRLKICKTTGYENEPSNNRVLDFPKNLVFEDVGTLDDAHVKWWALDIVLSESVRMNPGQQCVTVKAHIVALRSPLDRQGTPSVMNLSLTDRRTLAVGGMMTGSTVEQAPPETMEAYVYAFADTDFK